MEGRAYTPRDVLVDLARASGAPIFGVSDTFMGYGMTGGVVLRMEELGRELADMTAEALTAPPGKAPASRESRAHGTLFDWRELQRFGLSQRRLPKGAEIRFEPTSLWKTHRNAVLGSVTLLVGQSALIVAFIIQLRRRKKAEKKVLMLKSNYLVTWFSGVGGEVTLISPGVAVDPGTGRTGVPPVTRGVPPRAGASV